MEGSSGSPTIRVEIYNQTYNIRSDGDTEYIIQLAEFVDGIGNRRRRILLVTEVQPYGAAVRRDLVQVEDREPMGGEQALRGEQGEIREVLVVDGVEEVRLEQAHQMWELDRCGAVGREQRLHPADEVVQVRRLRENVVRDDQVGTNAAPGDVVCGRLAEERDPCRDVALASRRRDVLGRIDAEDPDPELDEMLEEIAVVASHLHDATARSEAEAFGGHQRVLVRVLYERIGVRRVVRVLGKDLLRRDVLR